eukprot:5483201-Amphidinium_carterae.1
MARLIHPQMWGFGMISRQKPRRGLLFSLKLLLGAAFSCAAGMVIVVRWLAICNETIMSKRLIAEQ